MTKLMDPLPVMSRWYMQAVYGVLSAIEGLSTFTDMMENTDIGNWYWATKELVNKHRNAS